MTDLSTPDDHHRPTAHHLLTLPPEIRSVIYQHLLSGPNKYILSPSARPTHYYSDFDLHPGPRRRRPTAPPGTSDGGGSASSNSDTMYMGMDMYAYAHPAANLLLTCRQLRGETQRAIAQHAHLYCSVHELELLASSSSSSSKSAAEQEWDQGASFLPAWLRLSLRNLSIYNIDPTRADPVSIPFSNPFASTSTSASTSASASASSSSSSPTSSSSHALTFQDTLTRRLLAERTSSQHAQLLRAFPALQTVDLVYFWPAILGRMKHSLEQFFAGKRDDQLVSLVRMAFRLVPSPESVLVVGGLKDRERGRVTDADAHHVPGARESDGGGDSDAKDPPGVRISVTGHFIEMEPLQPGRRRCMVSCVPWTLFSSTE